MRLILSLAPLFLSVVLLQLSSGGLGPLDALSGLAAGFSSQQIGLLGSAHFLGFFLGCWWAPRLMGQVGHTRAFVAFVVFGTLGLIAHMLWVDAYAWTALRVLSGVCIAGSYTVIEGWLMVRITRETRGRLTGIYRMTDMGASLLSQLLIGLLAPVSYASYNILALLCCAAILPLTLSQAVQPAMPEAPRLRPIMAWRTSPLAAVAVIVSALSAATFRMIGPVYGQAVGLEARQIAWFLALFVLGGALAQLPVGWLADRFDRRRVLVGVSLASILSCVASSLTGAVSPAAAQINAFFFGLATYPVYSIAAAHAHDFVDDDARAELSAALLFFYAIGAIFAPFVAAWLITGYGPAALFAMVAAGHLFLLAFGLGRIRVGRKPRGRTNYVWAPRTSFLIGRLTRRGRTTERR
ncbi:MFS transporter [Pseudooceanicola onchidii]|uniref:MFS transporter n=1 Tax=Pseudooceanicola onchidii TaxID=2562279 RepID=UPI0010AAAAAE|nr:MFS transporter [Pseudooceanicola onchidii]